MGRYMNIEKSKCGIYRNFRTSVQASIKQTKKELIFFAFKINLFFLVRCKHIISEMWSSWIVKAYNVFKGSESNFLYILNTLRSNSSFFMYLKKASVTALFHGYPFFEKIVEFSDSK